MILNKKQQYKISIITATWNSDRVVRKCLESVSEQTGINIIEHIIIDGGSTDGTLEIVSGFPHVAVTVSEKDRGIYHAFNKGLNLATGEFVFYLGSDDYLYDSCVIEGVLEYIDNGVDFISGQVVMEDVEENRRWRHVGREILINNKKYNHPAHQSFFIRTDVFRDLYGQFPECFRIYSDSYIMLRAISELNGVFINNVISVFSAGGVSNSDKFKFLTQKESVMIYDLLDIESKNNIYSVSASNIRSVQALKKLSMMLLNGKAGNFQGEYKIFGVAELSIIIFNFVIKNGGLFTGFVTTHGEKELVMGYPVCSVDELNDDDVVINGIEGAHAKDVVEYIISHKSKVTVVDWRDFIYEHC